jgi:hypothetical protein
MSACATMAWPRSSAASSLQMLLVTIEHKCFKMFVHKTGSQYLEV